MLSPFFVLTPFIHLWLSKLYLIVFSFRFSNLFLAIFSSVLSILADLSSQEQNKNRNLTKMFLPYKFQVISSDPSYKRCHCPIYNGTLNSFVWSSMNKLYLQHFWSDLGFKGTVVNRALLNLVEGLLETTVTFPFIIFFSFLGKSMPLL